MLEAPEGVRHGRYDEGGVRGYVDVELQVLEVRGRFLELHEHLLVVSRGHTFRQAGENWRYAITRNPL